MTRQQSFFTRPARFIAHAAIALAALTGAATQAADMRKMPIGDGVELAVRATEGGPVPVFFLHGYSLSMDTWEKVLPMFPASRYTTIAYDLRGFGDSSKPATGYTMTQHVKDLAALMDRMKIQRAVLVGHSLGGTIDQNRELLKGAVPRYFDPRNQNAADIERFIGITLKASTPALRDQLIDAYAFPQIDIAKYKALTMPVLAATGAVDNVVPAVNAILISDTVPNSEILMVPRAGHSPMWERPDAWGGPVVDFLNRRVK